MSSPRKEISIAVQRTGGRAGEKRNASNSASLGRRCEDHVCEELCGVSDIRLTLKIAELQDLELGEPVVFT